MSARKMKMKNYIIVIAYVYKSLLRIIIQQKEYCLILIKVIIEV